MGRQNGTVRQLHRRKLTCPFLKRSVCQDLLDKKYIGLEGTGGIHHAILMNCAAQAALKSALVSRFYPSNPMYFSSSKSMAHSMLPEMDT